MHFTFVYFLLPGSDSYYRILTSSCLSVLITLTEALYWLAYKRFSITCIAHQVIHRLCVSYTTLNGLFMGYGMCVIYYFQWGGRHGHDHMVVGFTTACTISAYHHQHCEFTSCSWRVVLDTLCDKVCQWLATG